MRENLKDLSVEEVSSWVRENGERSFRTNQILRWLFQKGARSFDEMLDIPVFLRERLAEAFSLSSPRVARRSVSADGSRKLLFALSDNAEVESVIIPMPRPDGPSRLTLCISSQVGCGMGCAFCATGTLGFRRNLTRAEIVDQITAARRDVVGEGSALPAAHEPIHNIVFMGMGEPLHNLDAVIEAIGIMTAEWGLSFSPRRITVSTVGLVPLIPRLLEETNVNLAVSLSGTTNSTRSALMPVNRKYPIEALFHACRELTLPRRRRITFEYVMLDGVNDTIEDARRLAHLLRGIRSKVNLIPFNPFPGNPFRPTPRPQIESFREELLRSDIHATVRESRGQDIQAACGQLAAA